jgi:DNA-binding beta-propeller fold protein YncE
MFSALIAVLPTAWAQDRLFVSNYQGDAITVYPQGTTGDVAPSTTISGNPGDRPHQIAIRAAAGELIVANNVAYSIAVYDLATGTLERSISGPSTGIVRPTGVAVDELHAEIFVANDLAGTITVYDVNATGDVEPKRTLQLSLANPASVAIDVVHDELIVTSYNLSDSIAVFERTATAGAPPKRLIQGPHTTLSLPQGVVLDLVHDEILVANSGFSTPNAGAVLAFRRTDTGDVAPLRTLEGGATQLCNPIGLALDETNDEVVVANSDFASGSCVESVTAYPRSASGDTPPTRMLAGSLTAMRNPIGVAMIASDVALPTVKVRVKPADHNVRAGEQVAYVIGAIARGGAVSDVVLVNTLPPGLAWSLGGADASACSSSPTAPNELTCNFGDLALGESRTIEVWADSTRASCPRITNQATVSFDDGTADVSQDVAPASIRVECRSRGPRGAFEQR